MRWWLVFSSPISCSMATFTCGSVVPGGTTLCVLTTCFNFLVSHIFFLSFLGHSWSTPAVAPCRR